MVLKLIWFVKRLLFIALGFVITSAIILLLLAYYLYFNFYRNYPLLKQDNKVNILVLGKGNLDHEAYDLTDTIILTSIDLEKSKIKTISLPRDIWDERLKAKLNSAYYWGKQNNIGGLNLAKQEVAFLTGLPIDYAVVVDFDLFKEIVDDLGGIRVNVKTAFDDYQYPIAGRERAFPIASRYQHIRFEAGWQTMTGDRALVFVRSRHAQGEEGSDFARSQRQQLVVKSIINSFLANKVYWLTHIDKAWSLANKWWSRLETDMTITDALHIALTLGLNHLTGQPITIKSLTFNLESPELKPAEQNLDDISIWVLMPDQSRLNQTIKDFVAN